MNRRKLQVRHAVVPVAEGEDRTAAVLRKAARVAAATALMQGAEGQASGGLMPFIAGYLAGFARHEALRHGVEPEPAALLPVLSGHAPALATALAALRFAPRAGEARAPLMAQPLLADAGYLVGHLESLCRSRVLLGQALALHGSAEGPDVFLTACDTAADPLQTHQPTASLRFNAEERAIVARALAGLD